MTTQEIREMLDSTINSNNTRGISGQSLNAALNAMVDVLEKGVPSPVSTDTVLDKNSNNPIANSAVATAIEEVTNAHSDLQHAIDSIKGNEMLVFDMSSGGTKLREYFTEYDLANKLDTPIACLVKFDGFDKATVATAVVESFDSSGYYEGAEMYKISFVTIGFTSKITAGYDPIDETEYYMPKYVWSSNCFINGGLSKAYLYTPSTNVIQSLGDGSVHYGAPNALIYKSNLDYENLQFGTTYYVMSIDEDDENRHFLDSILVCLQDYDPTGANRGYGWYNIKDGAFEKVYRWG